MFSEGFGDLRDDDAGFGDGGVVEQGFAAGLEVHPLAHADGGERVPRGEGEGEAPVEGVAVRLAGGGADDVVGGALVGVGAGLTELPGAVAGYGFPFGDESEVLLEIENVIRLFPGGRGEDLCEGLASAVFLHAIGAGFPGEEANGIEAWLF